MPKLIGQAKEQRIRQLHDSGKPHAEIAAKVGVNPATVKRLPLPLSLQAASCLSRLVGERGEPKLAEPLRQQASETLP